jgi:peptide/nickel transport system substrate-binding protein
LAAGLLEGHREAAAYGIVLPGDTLYEAGKDTLRTHTHDPARARAILREVGWSPGDDAGTLRNVSDGRRFRTSITGTQDFDRNIAAFASYWRQIGLEVEEDIVPASQTRNAEYRAGYPGWQVTSTSYGTLRGPAASAQTRWVGNRPGYDDPRFDALVDTFESTISEGERFLAMRAISDYVGAHVALLPVFYPFQYIGVRKGVKALEDHAGGMGQSQYGSFSRNAHLWDLE